jgi:hypothetical protein
LTFVAIAAVAGGVSYFKTVSVLEMKIMDRPGMVQIRNSPSERFSVFYVHSIYQEPVIEEFQVEGDTIVLKGVKTKSPAIMEYYGFEDTKEFHPMDGRLGALFIIRRGMGEGQGVLIRDRKIYLSEVGERGDRIQLRVKSMPLGKYMIGMLE